MNTISVVPVQSSEFIVCSSPQFLFTLLYCMLSFKLQIMHIQVFSKRGTVYDLALLSVLGACMQ